MDTLSKTVTHKPDEKSRKNKLYIIATTSLLAVGANSIIETWIIGGFYQGQISQSIQLKKSSVVLIMSEVSLNVPWH